MTQLSTSEIPEGFTEKTAQVNGVTLNYAIGGTGSAVVLLHGYPQTWYMWRKVMPALVGQYTVIAPNLRGSGGSDAPATGYDKAWRGGRSPAAGHLAASYAYFRTFHRDVEDTIGNREMPLAMPVLAIGGEGALGQVIPD